MMEEPFYGGYAKETLPNAKMSRQLSAAFSCKKSQLRLGSISLNLVRFFAGSIMRLSSCPVVVGLGAWFIGRPYNQGVVERYDFTSNALVTHFGDL